MELKRWNALVSLSSVALQTCFATFIWKPFVCALCNKLSLSIVEVLRNEDFHMLCKLWLAAAWVAAMWEKERSAYKNKSLICEQVILWALVLAGVSSFHPHMMLIINPVTVSRYKHEL